MEQNSRASAETGQNHSHRLLFLVCLWLALGCICTGLAIQNERVPGVFYDEAVLAGLAKDFVTGQSHGAHFLGSKTVEVLGRPFPVFVQAYVGAVEPWMLIPSFAVFGPSMGVWRLTILSWNLLGLLLFIFWADRLGGPWIAAIAAVLLALDPSFFFIGVLDWGLAVPSLVCRFGGFFLFLVAWQSNRKLLSFVAGILFGLGFFNKVDFAVILAGTTLAAILAYRRQLLSVVRSRVKILFLASLGFFLVIAPSVARLPKVLRFGVSRESSGRMVELSEKLHTTWTMYDGSYFYRLMAAGGRFSEMYKERSPVWTLFAGALLLASLVILGNILNHPKDSERPLQIFSFLAAVFISVGIIFLPGAVRLHHSTLVYPFPQLIVAAAVATLWRQWSGLTNWVWIARGVIAVVFLALVISDVRAIRHTQEFIRDTGGRGGWSEALTRFAEQVKKQPDLTIVSLDWGFNEQLLFLTDKPRLQEPIWTMSPYDVASLPKDPSYIYLVHTPEYQWFPIGYQFMRQVALKDPRAVVQTWNDRQGHEVFYTIRFIQ